MMMVMNKVTGRTLSNNLSFQNVFCVVCVNNRMFRILYRFVSLFQEDPYFAVKVSKLAILDVLEQQLIMKLPPMNS
jgi:hypothetical protein